MIHTIKNNKIQLSVKQTGAEICSLKSLESGQEYLWQANPGVWANHAPILFPIVGALKDKTFKYKGKEYSLPQHGFMRYNKNVELISRTTDSLSFSLKSNEESLMVYPFEFEFITTFTLKNSTVHIAHKVSNTADTEMYFSLGEHPAFKCPLHYDETYSDYYLEFEQNETAKSWQLDGSLIGNKSVDVFKAGNIIALHPDIFNNGALVFKDLKSKKISLKSKKSKQLLTVSYDGFPFMGIWAKPQAEFVCIEPWLGIADSIDTNQQFTDKEGIIKLDGKETYQAAYSIEIGGE
jgi:galactose mutarotase-like enzyme